MAKYSPSVRDDNTAGLVTQDAVSSSMPVGRRQKQGMKHVNDASRTQKTMGRVERKRGRARSRG